MGRPSPCYAVVTRLARLGRRLANVTEPLPPKRVQQGGAAAVPPEREGVIYVRRQVALHLRRRRPLLLLVQGWVKRMGPGLRDNQTLFLTTKLLWRPKNKQIEPSES